MRLAHPAGDQLRVLRPVVDDEDRVGLHGTSMSIALPCSQPDQRIRDVPSRAQPPATSVAQAGELLADQPQLLAQLLVLGQRTPAAPARSGRGSRRGGSGRCTRPAAPRSPRTASGARPWSADCATSRSSGGAASRPHHEAPMPCRSLNSPVAVTPGCAATDVSGRRRWLAWRCSSSANSRFASLDSAYACAGSYPGPAFASSTRAAAAMVDDRGHGHHPPGPRREQRRQQQPGQHVVAEVIRPELQLEAVDRAAEPRRRHHAGVVDQQVQRTGPGPGECRGPRPSRRDRVRRPRPGRRARHGRSGARPARRRRCPGRPGRREHRARPGPSRSAARSRSSRRSRLPRVRPDGAFVLPSISSRSEPRASA